VHHGQGLRHGQIVADGTSSEVKAMAAGRTVRATLPDADLAQLGALPGVMNADRHGDAVILTCTDSDAALRGLLGRFPAARDIEVHGSGLEEAFLALTADDNDDNDEARYVTEEIR